MSKAYWLITILVGLAVVMLGCAGKEPTKVEKSPTPLAVEISTPGAVKINTPSSYRKQ